jgi:hypothetical protein
MLGCEYAEKRRSPQTLEESLCAGEKLEMMLTSQINIQDPQKLLRKRPRKTQKEITIIPEKLYH